MEAQIAQLIQAAKYAEAEHLCRRLMAELEISPASNHQSLPAKNSLGLVLKPLRQI